MDIWIVVLPEGLSRRMWRVLARLDDQVLARSGSVVVVRPEAAEKVCQHARRMGARVIVIKAHGAQVLEINAREGTG